MGNSDSRPSFNYEAQLFADNGVQQSVEVDDPAGQPDNASKPRRRAGLEKGLVSVPYANGGDTHEQGGDARSMQGRKRDMEGIQKRRRGGGDGRHAAPLRA